MEHARRPIPRSWRCRGGEVNDLHDIALVETREEPCPECHQLCGWCSWYRHKARASGCGCPQHGRRRYRCTKAEAVKGTECNTCDGSRKVMVRREITRAALTTSPETNTG